MFPDVASCLLGQSTWLRATGVSQPRTDKTWPIVLASRGAWQGYDAWRSGPEAGGQLTGHASLAVFSPGSKEYNLGRGESRVSWGEARDLHTDVVVAGESEETGGE